MLLLDILQVLFQLFLSNICSSCNILLGSACHGFGFMPLGSACHGFGFMPLGSRKFWFSSKFFSLNLLCPSLKSCNTTVNVSIYLSIYSILSCITLSLTSFFISHNMTTSFTTGLAPWASLPPVFMFVGLSSNTKLPSAACSGRNSFLFHPQKWRQNVYVKIWSSCVATKHPRQHLNLF